MGGKTKTWYTNKTYNDGKWHDIETSRVGADSRFLVDDVKIPDRTPAITGNQIEASDTLFFGGYPQRHHIHDVTDTDFDGCIDNVVIMRNPVDLSQNIKAYGVIPGCPAKVCIVALLLV